MLNIEMLAFGRNTGVLDTHGGFSMLRLSELVENRTYCERGRRGFMRMVAELKQDRRGKRTACSSGTVVCEKQFREPSTFELKLNSKRQGDGQGHTGELLNQLCDRARALDHVGVYERTLDRRVGVSLHDRLDDPLLPSAKKQRSEFDHAFGADCSADRVMRMRVARQAIRRAVEAHHYRTSRVEVLGCNVRRANIRYPDSNEVWFLNWNISIGDL
jgi:hypothetical protein